MLATTNFICYVRLLLLNIFRDVLMENPEKNVPEGSAQTKESPLDLEKKTVSLEKKSDVALEKEEAAVSAGSEKQKEGNVPGAPALKLIFTADFKEDSERKNKGVLTKFSHKLVEMRLATGSVLRPYSFSYEIFDAEDLKQIEKLDVAAEGFESLGLVAQIKEGTFSLEGREENGKKPACDLPDGKVAVVAKVKVYINKTTDLKSLFEGNPCCDDKNKRTTVQCVVNVDEVPFPEKNLCVNPDPKTMWVEKEPTDPEFPKDNSKVEFGEIKGNVPLVVLGASQRGRSHANEGKYRDDHLTVNIGATPEDWSFFAVADGAGSAKYSREGSRIVCENVVKELREDFTQYAKQLDAAVRKELDAKKNWDDTSCEPNALERTNFYQFFYKGVYNVWNELKKLATERSVRINEFSTTFLCVALKRFPAVGEIPAVWCVVSYWVGDGGLAIYRPNGLPTTIPLGVPDGGEFAGQTRFITMVDEINQQKILSRMRLNFVEDFKAIVLMTDGLTDAFFTAEEDLKKYGNWKEFWENILENEFPGALDVNASPEARSQALLKGMGFFRTGNHDDRTLLMIVNDNCELTDAADVSIDTELSLASDNDLEPKNEPNANGAPDSTPSKTSEPSANANNTDGTTNA